MAKRTFNSPAPKRGRAYVLERTSAGQIRVTKQRVQAILRCYWNFHSELAYQRKQIEAELRAALTRSATAGFDFSGWQRAVKYKYGLHPLSAVGSLSDPGGRFNVGDIDKAHFPSFSALYFARDKDTALQEALGQTPPSPEVRLTARELALTNPQSETIVSVSGRIDTVFDLRDKTALQPFVDLIKGFTLSPPLNKEAARLGLELRIVRTPDEMLGALLSPDWRTQPMNYDTPAPSQLFGHMALLAGIEGIVYPSRFTGAECIAIFPQAIESSRSRLELDDPTPHPKVPTRIDSSNWQICELTPGDVIK